MKNLEQHYLDQMEEDGWFNDKTEVS